MVKKIFIGLICIACILVLGALYVTRDIAPTHPVLINSDLPPLIPTRTFYADPRAEYDYVASHDGKYVALTKASLMGRNIVVREVSSGKQIAKFPFGIQGIRWHPTKPFLRFIFEGHDWEADINKPEKEYWTRTSPIRLSGGWYKNQVAQNEEMKILTWGRSNKSDPGHMWMVSQDGLEAEKVAEGNSKTQYWMLTRNFEPVLRVDSLDPSTLRVFRKNNDNWKPLIDVSLNDEFYPLSLVGTDGKIPMRSSRGRDKAALVSFDTETGEETVILENPEADIAWETALSFDKELDIMRLGFNNLDRVAFTERGQVFLDILSEFPQPISFGNLVPTASGRYFTAAISSQSKSYIYLLIDFEEKSYIKLGEFHFRRFKDDLVQEKAVTFIARDGLEIPAVLTMPKNVSGPIPFIVHIHGGPARYVELRYDHDIQFLVNRGYGVLSVNFRGSKGFGKTFQSKGFKQFGRAMQDDITDAANWLVAEKLADPDALVAMGASYGGYSAALALTRDEGLFEAAIVEFPMLDVEFQSKYHPGFWENGIDGWWRYFGKVDNPDDLELMREYSPSNRINKLHGAMLVLGGLRDEITSVEQVKEFEAAAIKEGKQVEAHYFPDAGHGVTRWQDQLKRARLIEDFLAKHLGGRSGGFEFVEMAPDFIE